MTKIQTYVENMFSGLPKRKDIIEMKLEIIDNMEEKYRRLLESGKSEAEAFGQVILEFGSIEEIKKELGFSDYVANEETIRVQEEYEAFRKRFHVAITLGVGLCIFAVILLIGLGNVMNENSVVPMILFLSVILVAVCIFVYFGMQNEKYEDLKEGKNVVMDGFEKKEKKTSAVVDGLCGAVMLSATAIFLLLGFFQGMWHPAWVVFPVGGIVCGIIGSLASGMKK